MTGPGSRERLTRAAAGFVVRLAQHMARAEEGRAPPTRMIPAESPSPAIRDCEGYARCTLSV